MKTLAVLTIALTLIGGKEIKVNTLIGTEPGRSQIAAKFNSEAGESQGKTFPCVTEPHGMTSWTPQTQITEKKGHQPYNYRGKYFLGFRASHWMMGSATNDYGSFYVQPADGDIPLDHGSETAAPDYYSLAGCELTGRSHSAIMRFRDIRKLKIGVINEYGEGSIGIDTSARTVCAINPVHRLYAGMGEPAGFSGYFFLEYRDSLQSFEFSADGRSVTLTFAGDGAPLEIKAACSFSSVEAAESNLEAEIPHWDFERTRSELAGIWSAQLSVVEVETGDRELEEQFYSSLWRASMLPRVVSDVDGSYPAFGSPELDASGKLVSDKPLMHIDGRYYDEFSMWDTYRALHPLLNILYPSVGGEMMNSLVLKAQQGGWLPIFPCWGSYTSAMIGYHTVSALCDAWQKGIGGFDRKDAYKVMRQLAFGHPEKDEYRDGKGIRALESYERLGYIPLEDPVREAFHKGEQVSRTLEYAYDDHTLSRVAFRSLHFGDWIKLHRRSRNWKNVFDPRTGYVQGRHEDGSFLDTDSLLVKPHFITEGTPMQYSWYVPHDVRGLQEVMAEAGGDFTERLDTVFGKWYYWHGNEPSHHIVYLYDYTQTPYKAQRLIREILKSEYADAPNGLSGNDDAGQMAAWYIFSTMGFYPVCPGGKQRYDYAIGSPCFDRVTIHLENGKEFIITAPGTSDKNCYVQEVTLNGRRHRSNFITYRDIMRGGSLDFTMGASPR